MRAAGPDELPDATQASAPALSVIAPCYNESGNVELLAARTLATFDAMGVSGELVLVDDGSTDRTWQAIREAEARHPDRVRGVRHERNSGIEAGWRSGMRAARGPLVCLIDADLQNPPEDIARLHHAFVTTPGADLVQGVRRPARGVRRLHGFSRALNALLNTTFGMHLQDSKSGFILCPRTVLGSLLTHRHAYRYFQSFIGCAAGVRGFNLVEIDTRFDPRNAGASFLSRFPVIVSARIAWEILLYRAETW